MRLVLFYLIAHESFQSQSLPLSSRIVKDVGSHGIGGAGSFAAINVPDKPKNFYPETVGLLLSGHPWISKTRSPECRSSYEAMKQKFSEEGRCKVTDMYERLQWPEHLEVAAPSCMDMESLQDERICKWRLNEFPYQTPVGVDHHVIWLRGPLVNKESFTPREGESWPSKDYINPNRVSALLEYIEQNEFYGYVGPRNVDNNSQLNIGEYLHPGRKPYKASNGQLITQEEGWEVFKWASRHFNAYLEGFMTKYKEMVWIRSPDWKKSINIEHVHVLGLLKEKIQS